MIPYSRSFVVVPLLLTIACGSEPSRGQPSEERSGSVETSDVSSQALQDAASGSPAETFYEINGWAPVWNKSQEDALLSVLDERARHGLDRLTFIKKGNNRGAQREIALTEAVLAYASALSNGLLNPNDLYEIYSIPRPEQDLVSGLADALSNGSLEEWLQNLAPQDAEYAALSRAYLDARELAKASSDTTIEEGSLIRIGDSDPRVPGIARALVDGNYLERSGSSRSQNTYTTRMAEAIEQLQSERGIAVDGIVGPDTLEALNTSPADRARAAAVALERRRWLVRKPPATRIDVNTASTSLEYIREGSVADTRRVIVGQPDWATPQLQSPIYRLVANPTWTVPRSIEEEELSDLTPSELAERKMERREGWLVQLPGPENALGLVKFDMANDHAIYLHDTSARQLFQRNLRQLSHGCVRVADALGFAKLLARDQEISSEWQEARGGGEDTFLRLPDRIPVRLLYHPTYVAPSGDVRFAQDIYGWNGPIGKSLGFGAGDTRKFVPQVKDLGP